MPAMPRPNNKFRKIAYNILGVPDNMKKPSIYADKPDVGNQSGLDELHDIRRVTPQNYF